MKLLIVDDNKYVVAVIQHQIDWGALGIDGVYGVYSVRQAREILEREQIDLLLVDIEMPEENGFVLVDWLQKKQMPIRIVILTSFAEYDYAEKAIFYHAYSYLLKPVSDERLIAVFRDLVHDEQTRRENARFAEVGKQSVCPDSEPADARSVSAIRKYIQENLDHVTRADISAKFYLSPDYLSRVFRQEQGMSLMEYIQQERIQHAKVLLSQDNGLSIGQIAGRVGYPSFAHFSKQFRKIVGISPSQYRKNKLHLQSITEYLNGN